MNKIRKLLLSCGLLLLPSLAYAVPVTDFVDTLFIGGGVMLFIAGVLLLLVPGLFKTGVLTTLLADILFMARMLFPDALEQSIAAQTDWQPLIESTSTGSSRIYAVVSVAIVVVSILSLRWLLHSFFAPALPKKQPAARAAGASTVSNRSGQKAARSKTRLNRDRDDFSGYTEAPPAAKPEPQSPAHNKRFRVHDYLENLEQQQAQPVEPRQQDAEPVIHFDRIER
jgi:hypothetical protein